MQTVTKAQIEAALPPDTRNVNWQVYEFNGKITLAWDLTFRRNTRVGAFSMYGVEIEKANINLKRVAIQFKDAVIEVQPYLAKDARDGDKWARDNGDDAYSEYEQSFGGHVQFRS